MAVFKKSRKKINSGNDAPALATWPFWANWCALDPIGYWIFFENKPELTVDGWLATGVKWGEPRESVGTISVAWQAMLISAQDAK